MNAVRETARALCGEARETNERRALVLAGERGRSFDAVVTVCSVADCEPVFITDRESDVRGERLPATRTDELLGTTKPCVVVDCHDACRPNTLGRAVGAVDGGGLFVLCTPPLSEWPTRRDEFDERLAVPPFGLDDVGGAFRARLVDTLSSHRGVAIVDVDAETIVDDGRTHPSPRLEHTTSESPQGTRFSKPVYDACLTADQFEAVRACERLAEPGSGVVLEADRGRGKSSAAGLAAAGLAAEGRDVLVTAPGYRNAETLFERAVEGLDALGALGVDDRDGDRRPTLTAIGGGSIRFRRPIEAVDETAAVLVVDEAAALPVRLLESLLDVAESACFATTVHGYEGAGRGFDVRFRDRLDRRLAVTDVVLSTPIRYASADPIETWVFRALCLDARPAVDPLVTDATVEDVTYTPLETETLVEDENLLRETFGLLVYAHYRTEPDDLARLLDAPNIRVRALVSDGHVVSVALLAREGGLSNTTREAMYTGSRVRGNMLPDVLTSQLRDPEAGVPTGLRVMRIATHHAVRSRGFGSRLLEEIEREVEAAAGDGSVDWLGVGYGATPELLDFWAANGYTTVHLSTTRNATSGEYSALMLKALTEQGTALTRRHTEWFGRRIPAVLGDALDDADLDVVRAALEAANTRPRLDLSEVEWRVVAAAAYGPGLYDVAPRPFRRLATRALIDGTLGDDDAERLLVAKVLQSRSWDAVTDDLGYVSRRECMRALGDAYRPLVDRYGTAAAAEEADRHR